MTTRYSGIALRRCETCGTFDWLPATDPICLQCAAVLTEAGE
jgi:hypothetical protein